MSPDPHPPIPNRIPKLMAISDRLRLPLPLAIWATLLAEVGVPWIQLRERDLTSAALLCEALALSNVLPSHTRLSINGWHPSLLNTLASNTSPTPLLGLHLGEGVRRGTEPLPQGALVGRAVHGRASLAAALSEGIDYVLFSPVYTPSCKPGTAGAGLEALAEIVKAAGQVPVLALGGITSPEQVRACISAGAHGVAVMAALQGADAQAVARALLS